MSTFIKISDIKQLIINHKDNVGGALDKQIIEYAEFMNRALYYDFAGINPNDYLINYTLKTIIGKTQYALPGDFQDIKPKRAGVFEQPSGSTFGAINFDNSTVDFDTIPQTITGATSGATGTLTEVIELGNNTGTLILTDVSTDKFFEDNEIIAGSTEGSATANGGLISYRISNRQSWVEGDYGDDFPGFWFDKVNLNFNPDMQQSKVFTLRYLPELDPLTKLTEETIIPIQFKEYARNAADVFWQQWKGNENGEFAAGQRTTQALRDMLQNIRKTSGIMKKPDKRGIYAPRLRRSRRYSITRN